MDNPPDGRKTAEGRERGETWRRRRLLGTGIAGGLGLALSGGLVVRNQIRHPHKDKRAQPDGKPRRLVLAAPGFARDPILLAAQDQDVFARYSLDIRFLGQPPGGQPPGGQPPGGQPSGGQSPQIGSGQEALDAVQSGRADGAVAAALSWLPRLQSGLDARLVCGLQAGSARLLIARHSPMHRIEDLYRRTIGIANPDGPDRLFFSIMMRRKGMNPDRDVEWRALPQDALGLALAEGQVQAIAGHDPVIWELRQSLHLDELASSMSGSYGARVSRVLGLRSQLLRDDPKAAVAITMAIQESAAWVAGHLQQVGVLVAAEDPSLTLDQARRMLKSEGHDVHPTGLNLRNQIAQYVDELKLLGITPESVDSATFANRVTANVLKA